MSEITRNEAIRIVEDIRTAISAGSVTNTMEARVLEYCVVVLGRSIEEASQSGSIVNLPDVAAFLAGISSSTTLRELLSDITGKIPSEASSANKLADKAFVTTAINGLQNALNNINTNIGNGYVYAGIATPSGTPVSGKVFYLAKQAGQYTNFGGLTVTEGINILKRNGSTWTQEQLLSMADIYKNPLIGYYECDTAGDTAAKTVTAAGYVLPTTGGSVKIKMANLNTVANATLNINSTGAKPLYYNGQRAGVGNTWDTNEIIEVFYDGTNYQAHNVAGSNGDGVFDISAYNLTDGQPTPYENLEAALGQDGDNVPRSLRKGGMSIKFVQSPDNMYVQYRLMSQTFSADEADWQGVTGEVQAGSKDLVESGDIYNELNVLNIPISVSGTYTGRYNMMDVNIPQGTTVKFTVHVQGLSNNDISRLTDLFFLYGDTINEYDYRFTLTDSIRTQLQTTGSYSFDYTPGHNIVHATLWFISGTIPTSGNIVTFTTQEYRQKYVAKGESGNILVSEVSKNCEVNASGIFFDNDVNIPSGSIIKFEITGYNTILSTSRYSINNGSNIQILNNIAYYKVLEDITHISFGYSSGSVIIAGTVSAKISILSETEKALLNTNEHLLDIDEQLDVIDRKISDIQLDTDGITLGEPTVTCTPGVKPVFFDDDVDIPSGKDIKFEILSGYPDFIVGLRYSINGAANQGGDGSVFYYKATERVTHLKVTTSSSSVVGTGDVQVGIYVMSEFAETLENHETRITALESKVGDNSYETDIDEIAEKVFNELSETSGANEEKVVFLHVTDTHSSDGEQYYMNFERAMLHMNIVGQVAKAVNANFVIHTGDAIHGVDSTSVPESYRALLKGYTANIPLIFCEGNYAHDFGNNNEKLVRGQVQSFFGHNKMWIENRTVYNTNDAVKSYFYFDDDKTKIRYIVLDAQDAIREGWKPTGERIAYGFSPEQTTFVTAALADALTNGYAVFFFAHMPPTANLYPLEEGEDNSYGIETGGHGDVLIAAIKDFIDDGGVMLGFSYGHIHQDNIYYDSVTGIQYIGLVSDAPTKKSHYPVTWGTLVAWDRNLNDVTQFAFDVYVVSPTSKKVKILRFGAGVDRQYTLS